MQSSGMLCRAGMSIAGLAASWRSCTLSATTSTHSGFHLPSFAGNGDQLHRASHVRFPRFGLRSGWRAALQVCDSEKPAEPVAGEHSGVTFLNFDVVRGRVWIEESGEHMCPLHKNVGVVDMLQVVVYTFLQLIASGNSFHVLFSATDRYNRIALTYANNKIDKAASFMAMTTERTTTTDGASPVGKKRPLRSVNTMVDNRRSLLLSSMYDHATNASMGDIVTVELELTPENGYVPEHLFDSSGEVSFVLGWGNYLPGLHELLLDGMSKGDSVTNVSVDAGFGRHSPDMVIEVPKRTLKKVQNIDRIVPNATLSLQGGIQVVVVDVTKETIIVDANHPLAGSSYSCNLKVLNIDRCPLDKFEFVFGDDTENKSQDSFTNPSSPFEVATFAMGCFWSVELAFMRTPGVVGTRAGYTQGIVENPSYEEIKEGRTGHREAVIVIYDSRVVSYEEILAVYNERLAVTVPEYFKLDIFAEEDEEDSGNPDLSPNSQYKHGIYFHNKEQKKLARDYIASIKDSRYCDVELLPATVFYSARDDYQQYLYKGGQAARKGCRETIRCYG